jgi:hexulose-6-phosphate isomerase
MTENPSRRDFLKASTLVSMAPIASKIAAAQPAANEGPGTASPRIKKAVQIYMLPTKLSYAERFKLAGDVGFEGVEAQTVEDPKVAEEIKKASDAANAPIHSVMNMAHWKYPLSSSDPAVVQKSLDGMKTSLHNAKLWGAETVLLVPGVLDGDTRYKDAWTRSQKNIRTLIPLAEELKVIIAIEEVWNKFLLSPLEMATYVDQYKSPWIRQYFDVGNVVLYGYPQDWIHTLGRRIVKVHLKDFKASKGWTPFTGQFVNLGDGDIDWTAVRKAFADIGYTGWTTTELDAGDEAYLREVAKRVDKLVLGM